MKGREIALLALAALFAVSAAALLALLLEKSGENTRLGNELSSANANLSSVRNELKMTREELRQKNGDIARQQSEIENFTLELENRSAEIERLWLELNESEAELEETRNTLAQAEEDIARIRDEALAMDEQINESIQWFRNNSALPSTLKVDRFMNRVEKGCEGGGSLNLACVSYLMGDELGFSYKDDPTGDRLYSIGEILQRKGGDCEDYSLFFKAFLNRMRGEGLEIEAWAGGTGRYVVYEDAGSGRYWYYDDAEGVGVGATDSSKPYAVCYFFASEGDTRIGHCVIMLTDRTIASPQDITNEGLAGSALIEPQDGEFLGRIGDGFTACEDGDGECGMRDYALTFIITDDDLYQFSDGEWGYYSGRGEELEGLLKRLEGVELD